MTGRAVDPRLICERVRVQVLLQRDGVTKPGEVVRIKGEGMPNVQNTRKGDLVVTYSVAFPSKLTAEQKAAVRKLFG